MITFILLDANNNEICRVLSKNGREFLLNLPFEEFPVLSEISDSDNEIISHLYINKSISELEKLRQGSTHNAGEDIKILISLFEKGMTILNSSILITPFAHLKSFEDLKSPKG